MYQITVRSWWVWLFLLCSYAIFDLANTRLGERQERLEAMRCVRRNQLAYELDRQQLLHQQIHSQSDPAYIELVLMRELGVVPDGQQKVIFD